MIIIVCVSYLYCERIHALFTWQLSLLIFVILIMVTGETVEDNVTDWSAGGPKDIYVKPLKKSPYHGIYDESMKCLDCHRYDGVPDRSLSCLPTRSSSTE